MKNAFYFMWKALFVLKIFKILSRIFGHVEKRIDKKASQGHTTTNCITFQTVDPEINSVLIYKGVGLAVSHYIWCMIF